ncbi:hypothetical protein ACI2I2_12000 [Scandinavium sp. NPDC088450]|uniref:hypothetical protein n=1 Tax=Scandinavium sp. NPDC088450 TaxID=3364514 RepID=UPI00384CC9C2
MKIDNNTAAIQHGYTVWSPDNKNSRKHLGYEQYSGTECQQTGQWQASLYATQVVVSVQKGTVMPYHKAQAVRWKLIDYGVDEKLLEKSQS